MARTVKEYDERYNEFLHVGQRLFYQKGYAQTSVQDIIGEMGVAKGLFYYYFPSKTDLLDAILERIGGQVLAALEPM
ncbi:MAG: TetR/AcrR family transcriptional regulator, partial [Caldilinea sp.]